MNIIANTHTHATHTYVHTHACTHAFTRTQIRTYTRRLTRKHLHTISSSVSLPLALTTTHTHPHTRRTYARMHTHRKPHPHNRLSSMTGARSNRDKTDVFTGGRHSQFFRIVLAAIGQSPAEICLQDFHTNF